jgi:hypothetical protein
VRNATSALERVQSSRSAARRQGARRTGAALGAREIAGAKRARRSAIDGARATIAAEVARLEQLGGFNETAERASLLGSAMKRLAELERASGRAAAEQRAVEAMARHYQRAVDLVRERKADNLFYPAINLVVAEIVLGPEDGTSRRKPRPAAFFEEARGSIAAKNRRSPDFWSLVAEPELRLYEALLRGTIRKHAPVIVRQFRDVHRRSQGATPWSAVVDTLRFALDPYLARAKGAAGKAARQVLEDVAKLGAPATPQTT